MGMLLFCIGYVSAINFLSSVSALVSVPDQYLIFCCLDIKTRMTTFTIALINGHLFPVCSL